MKSQDTNFDRLLNLAKESFPSKKLICPTCKEEIVDENDRIAVEEIGECLSCDHLKAEEMEQRAYDEWKDEGCPERPEA
jgi:hypothetical protein